ncbi:sensor histidine kinase [Paraflavitalea pollutisoli]|uniref:sensor histidine kinase n=1 Tax=Paraflavitalea pollutisoli TaxID=3034143 RepID=UPI0023EE14E6|nr:HAMP domain-containing sensor histidine kinase [Paraflavitalea sp. H1-2-19X]
MHPIYDKLSRIGFLSRSYTFKFLFIAFLGIHVPLIGLLVFVLLATGIISTGAILLITLILTLAATAATLLTLNGLLAPLRQSQRTLQEFLNDQELPQLPTHYHDEAGQLMQHIQLTLTELNNVLEEKKDLTALLSHDLRTPLRNVQTYAGMIQDQALSPDEIKEFAEAITESAREQQQILENILEILRMDYLFQDGNRREATPLQPLIEEVMQTMGPLASHKQIRLSTQLNFTGDVQVHSDLFKQVLKNLVSNAIKFSHAGSEVSMLIQRQQHQTIIEVTDKGIGFDADTAEQLFDRFTRSGRRGTAGEPSTGLGLYLSRKIIRHQQGDLQAYSADTGKGATFTISLN